VAGQRLVDGVVDDLVDHVVQARAVVGVADIHARALADGVEALQHLDAENIPHEAAESVIKTTPDPPPETLNSPFFISDLMARLCGRIETGSKCAQFAVIGTPKSRIFFPMR
jgi:hypothetical protein